MLERTPSAAVAVCSLPLVAITVALVACGGAAPVDAPGGAATSAAASANTTAAPASDWPMFGLNAQRSNASNAPTGITAANVSSLRQRRVALPGTADSSPIYLHAVGVGGAPHDVFIVTTTYGKTVAVDANSGAILWTFAPPGAARLQGSSQITTASPVADPGRRFVYAATPTGRVYKLALASGHPAAGRWPVVATRDASHEKLSSALNLVGNELLIVTGGYYGDAPPYQGHVITVDRRSGRVLHVFNTLCANRHRLLVPSSCGASDAAIWARAGAVVEPGSRRLLVATGNGPYNGTTNFGQSVLELTPNAANLRQAYTPANQAALTRGDTDLGSTAPALLGGALALQGGKDGLMRLLNVQRLDGSPPGGAHHYGGELQVLGTPGHSELFTAPAVWHHGGATTLFVADDSGTAAYALRARRLAGVWQNSTAGSSPVIAGGLLWVYDVHGGGLVVYRPDSGQRLATLPAGSGHWNSPVIAGGHVALPEGNANDYRSSGVLEIYSLR